MPAFALIAIARRRWLPPIPVPLFLLWPLILILPGMARLLDGSRPTQAAKLRGAVDVFRELRGLKIDVDTAGGERVRIWFV